MSSGKEENMKGGYKREDNRWEIDESKQRGGGAKGAGERGKTRTGSEKETQVG